jgi:hypothetical protein
MESTGVATFSSPEGARKPRKVATKNPAIALPSPGRHSTVAVFAALIGGDLKPRLEMVNEQLKAERPHEEAHNP